MTCTLQAMNPDVYQGLWGGSHCRDSPVQTNRQCDCKPNECHACDMYYCQLEEVFKYSVPTGKLAGFFAESIQAGICLLHLLPLFHKSCERV
jgi:alanine-glyoxylate transaminase/(R)-3-amino-2-methylpropionate-pyruvate transaminase